MNSKSARSARSASGARSGANIRNLIDLGDKTSDRNLLALMPVETSPKN